MTENVNESKWDMFAMSGKISDYLEYKGISLNNSILKGDNQIAVGDSKGTCNIGTQHG